MKYTTIYPIIANGLVNGNYLLIQISLNPSTAHSRCKSVTNYTFDKPLKDVDSFKDLGVTTIKDL